MQTKLAFWPKILFGFVIFEEKVRARRFFGLKNSSICVKYRFYLTCVEWF